MTQNPDPGFPSDPPPAADFLPEGPGLPPARDPDKQALEYAIRWMMAPIAGVLMCLGFGFFGYVPELLVLTVLVSCAVLPLGGGAVHRSWKVVRAGYGIGFVVLVALYFSLYVWPSWVKR
jgi:hypothetical protein